MGTTTFSSEMISTDLVEFGKPVRLQLCIAKPAAEGPHPVLIFNHGSTGTARSPTLFRRTVKYDALAEFFCDRGWMTIFPQRRGRGNSEGQYGEGLQPGGVGYSCDSRTAIAGASRALDDLTAVMRHVLTRPDVLHSRMLIGGSSRGGALALACAAKRPDIFVGALNFSGGWLGQGCNGYEAVNQHLFQEGANFRKPTLWLYGKRDNYYPINHCRSNFQAFVESGGIGSFKAIEGGHMLVLYPRLWEQSVGEFLSSISRTSIPETVGREPAQPRP